MPQLFGGAKNEVGIEMRPFKNLVHVAASVRHLLGKPCHAAALPAQLRFDKMAKMYVGHGPNLPFPTVRGSQCRPLMNKGVNYDIIKKRGSRNFCLSRSPGLRIAHHPRISNARNPRWFIYTFSNAQMCTGNGYKTHERNSLPHRADDSEVAKFGLPQIKRQFNAVSIMSANHR